MSIKRKSLILFTLILILTGVVNFYVGKQVSRVTQPQVMACVSDPFVVKVAEVSQFKLMYSQADLLKGLSESRLPPAEMKMYSDVIDYVYKHKEPVVEALTECLQAK